MKNCAKTTFDDLPQDLREEILLRLKFTSLAQYICVSKSWYSCITSKSFINHHLKISVEIKPKSLVKFTSGVQDRYLLCSNDYFPSHYSIIHGSLQCSSRGYSDQLPDPFETKVYNARIVGSCDGVFCVVNNLTVNCKTVLWNPSIRKTVHIPMPCDNLLTTTNSIASVGFGFGCDPKTNNLKFVRIAYPVQDSPLLQVYCLETGWKTVSNDLKYVIGDVSDPMSAFVNGACHWVANTPRGSGKIIRNSIVVFDLERETVREMAVPDCFASEAYMNMTLTVCDGSLFLVPFNRSVAVRRHAVWMMKEYGVADYWVKIFCINRSVDLKRVIALKGIYSFFIESYDGSVVVYNADRKEICRSKVQAREFSFYAGKYKESLVLMGKNYPPTNGGKEVSMGRYVGRRQQKGIFI